MVNIDGFRLLGRFRVEAGGMPITMPRRHVRFLLAMLLLDVGRPVPVDRLIQSLWPDRQPPDARAVLRTYVSRLRTVLRELNGIELSRAGNAYVLSTDPELVDVYRFRQLVGRVRATQDAAARAALAREALALWQGPALCDAGDEEACAIAGAGLEELRKQMVDARITADLELGQHEPLIGDLIQLVAASPLNERLVGQLVTALYRSGRRADALNACRDARARLADHLGLDPSPALQELEIAVLRADPALDLPDPVGGTGAPAHPTSATTPTDPAPAVVDASVDVPAQLPATGGYFVGRTRELAALDAIRAGGTRSSATVVVCGPPGVGKTAIAIQWGRRSLDQFPDGQLFLDLRGYGLEAPMVPLAAMTTVLLALGLPYDQIPVDLDDAAGRYRSRLAGRRVLVVLDNAATAEQVRPLLTPSAGSLVLVTSRDSLDGLVAVDGARQYRLAPFTAAESHEMLAVVLGEGWLSSDAAAAAGLADACGHLPLALRIVATHLHGAATEELPAYVYTLRHGSMRTLRADGDDNRAVRTAFDHSYRRLNTHTQAMFRAFGQVPLATIGAEVAATLARVEPDQARDLLARLVAANLCEEPSRGWFAMHDLLREYAVDLGRAEDVADRETGLDRLYAYYLGRVDAAAKLLYPQMRRLPMPDAPVNATVPADPNAPHFASRDDALDWLNRESANFLPLVRHATHEGRLDTAWLLADWLRGYFWLWQRTGDWLWVATAALRAAESAGDLRGQCASHLSLSLANLCMSRYRVAASCVEAGLVEARQASWTDGEAACLGTLGSVNLELGELEHAEANYRDAMLINRRLERSAAEATNRGNLAIVQMLRGRFAVAADNFRRVLAYQRSAQLAASEALNLLNLGMACRELGLFVEAAKHLSDGAVLHREVGNAQGEASALAQLAAVRCDEGRLDEAMHEVQVSLDLIQEFDDPATESEVRQVLGAIWQRRGKHARAILHYTRAAELADELSRPEQKIAATIGLAQAEVGNGDLDAAHLRATEVVELARQRGYLHHAGCAMTLAALIDLGLGDVGRAAEEAERALAIHRETGHRLGEVRTLWILGDVAQYRNDAATAGESWHAASEMLAALGIDDRGSVWWRQELTGTH